MIFVGIIEENRNVVYEITQYFLRQEDYSLLFVCSSLDEYRALPPGKRNRASIIISNAGQNQLDVLWQAKYLKQVNREARILFLTDTILNEELGDRIRKAGADTLIHKHSIAKDLVEFFGDDTMAGQIVPERPAPDSLVVIHNRKKPSLSPREYEIIDLVVKGYTNKKIGEQLFISPYTVNAHLRKIFIKLSINSRTALINHVMNELR